MILENKLTAINGKVCELGWVFGGAAGILINLASSQ
jgi:hypothetical protein